MLEVDELRFEPRVQAAYDVCDDVTWFIRVTDQLYLQAVKRALPGEPPSVEYDAMQQVYQVRADARERGDDAMLELLSWLRANQFKTFIVSGGGIDFMQAWTERAYGIPPEQIVGSSGVTRYSMAAPDKPVLLKEDRVEFIDDGPGKAEGIERFIGRRPVLAFGNADGDQQMLEWTAAGPGARLMGLVHHTDAVREYAYDRQSKVGRLDKAWDEAVRRDWLVVDMQRDWKVVFPFELR